MYMGFENVKTKEKKDTSASRKKNLLYIFNYFLVRIYSLYVQIYGKKANKQKAQNLKLIYCSQYFVEKKIHRPLTRDIDFYKKEKKKEKQN